MRFWDAVSGLAALLALAVALSLVVRNMQRPSVAMVSLGAVRADTLRSWASIVPAAPAGPLAPTLAHLCDIGICFTQAYSNAPYARAASATVLTGTLAAHHGVRGPLDRLSATWPQLAELFAASGYDTGAVVGSYEVDSIFGFRGFSTFDGRFFEAMIDFARDPLPVPPLVFHDWAWAQSARLSKLTANARKPDERTTDSALGFLAHHRHRRFFLWVQYFGASPLGSLEGPVLLSPDRYAERVRELDRELERLLDGIARLGVDENLWLFVYGDAGFALFEHGEHGVGASLYEPSVRVPLIVVPPRYLRSALGPRHIDTPVSLLDLAPTVAELLRLPVKVPWPFTGFAKLLRESPEGLDPERVIPLENYWTATTAASKEVRTAEGRSLRVGVQMRGVRKGRWKYLVRERSPLVDARLPLPEPAQVPAEEPREELYDIAADPMERLNLAATKPEQCVALRRYLPPVAATQEQ